VYFVLQYISIPDIFHFFQSFDLYLFTRSSTNRREYDRNILLQLLIPFSYPISLFLAHTHTHARARVRSVSRALLIAMFIARKKRRQNLKTAKSFVVTIWKFHAARRNEQWSRASPTNGGTLVTPRGRSQLRSCFGCIRSRFPHPLPFLRRAARARHGGNRIPRVRNYFESSRPTVGLTTRTW